MYAFSRDGGNNWFTNAGTKMTQPAAVDTPGIRVVPIDEGYGLFNSHGQAVDSQERLHVVLRHCDDESLKAAGSLPGESALWPA